MRTGMPATQTTTGSPANTSLRPCFSLRKRLPGPQRYAGSGCANTQTSSSCLALMSTLSRVSCHHRQQLPHHHHPLQCQRLLRRRVPVSRCGVSVVEWAGQGRPVASQGVSVRSQIRTTISAFRVQSRLHHRRQRRHHRRRLRQQTQHRRRPLCLVGYVLAVTAQFGEEALDSLLTVRASAIRTSVASTLTSQAGAVLGHQVGGAAQTRVCRGSISFQRMKAGASPLIKFMHRAGAHTEHLRTSSFATGGHIASVGLGKIV